MTPSPRLFVIMLAGLPVAAMPVLIGPVALPLVFGLWGAILIGLGLDALALFRARPKVEAEVPTTVGVGDRLEIPTRMELGGKRRLQTRMRLETTHPLVEAEEVEDWFEPGISELLLEVAAPTRGQGTVPAIWLRLDGPLRLLSLVKREELTASLVRIIPNASRVRSIAVQFFAGSQAGSQRLKRLGDGTELDSLEAYEPGMDLRQVDWKSSARHHGLRVRRFRLERNQRVVVCLDTGRLSGDIIDGTLRIDHAVHAAMALSWVALRAGDLVGLDAYAAEPIFWLPPRAGMPQMRVISEACARLQTRDEETNHVLGMQSLLTRLRRRTLIVVLTEIGDPTSSELMVRHVRALTDRHLVILVALDDPSVSALATASPTNVDELAKAVVATELRRDRERVISRLRRAGADVVSAPPNRAALDLLTRYIRLKKRRLLG